MTPHNHVQALDIEAIIAPYDVDRQLAENCKKVSVFFTDAYAELSEDYWSFWKNSPVFGPSLSGETTRDRAICSPHIWKCASPDLKNASG